MPRTPRNRAREPRFSGPYKHGAIPVIGLIGGIGAGKSRVAALLAEAGAFVIDADLVGHALLEQRPVRDLVVAQFGSAVRAHSGDADADAPPRIDRRALGAIVFATPEALRRLEAILHPRMRRTFERAIARVVRRGRHRAIVLDAAILLEAGWHTLCDQVVLVDAPRAERLARLAAARSWSEQTLAAREAAQWPLERKRALADVVLSNDSGIAALEEKVRRLAATWLPPALPAAVRPPRGAAVSPKSRPGTPAGPRPPRPADRSGRP